MVDSKNPDQAQDWHTQMLVNKSPVLIVTYEVVDFPVGDETDADRQTYDVYVSNAVT